MYRWILYLVSSDPKHFYSVRYEPELFKFKANRWNCRGYVPDFKVFTSKGIYYIEVKGFMDVLDRAKIFLFHRDYPYLKLRVIGPTEFKWVQRRIKDLGV